MIQAGQCNANKKGSVTLRRAEASGTLELGRDAQQCAAPLALFLALLVCPSVDGFPAGLTHGARIRVVRAGCVEVEEGAGLLARALASQ